MNARQGLIEQHDAAAHLSATPNWDTQGQLTRIFTLTDAPSVFQGELVAALDEFVMVVRESREKIASLSAQLTEREALIALLEAKNTALEAKLVAADGKPAELPPAAPVSDVAPIASPEKTDPAKEHGIWRRLKRLEHD